MDSISIHQELVRIFSNFSIEILPREANEIDDYRDHIPKGTHVFIAFVPNVKPIEIVDTAKKIYDQEMVPVPHVPARKMVNTDYLSNFINLLSCEANVTELLVIGGDPDPPEGEFESALSILETGILQMHGMEKIGIAIHPEGHPSVEQNIIQDSITKKINYCRYNELEPFLVSQFMTSSAPIIKWFESSILSIQEKPDILVGIPGLVTPSKLLKFARQCGIKAPMKSLIKHKRNSLKLISATTPDQTLIELAKYNIKSSNIAFNSIHIYPFGTFNQTSKWASNMAMGNFKVKEYDKDHDLELLH